MYLNCRNGHIKKVDGCSWISYLSQDAYLVRDAANSHVRTPCPDTNIIGRKRVNTSSAVRVIAALDTLDRLYAHAAAGALSEYAEDWAITNNARTRSFASDTNTRSTNSLPIDARSAAAMDAESHSVSLDSGVALTLNSDV